MWLKILNDSAIPTVEQLNGAWVVFCFICTVITMLTVLIKNILELKGHTSGSKLAGYVENDDKRIKSLDRRVDDLEERMNRSEKGMDEFKKNNADEIKQINKSINMIGRSCMQMCRHMAMGNGTDKLTSIADNMEAYFMDDEKKG